MFKAITRRLHERQSQDEIHVITYRLAKREIFVDIVKAVSGDIFDSAVRGLGAAKRA